MAIVFYPLSYLWPLTRLSLYPPTIGGNAFFECPSITNLTIPESVTSIDGYAFYNSAVSLVTIPDSVTNIEAYAFYGGALTSVAIPQSITSIGDGMFAGCLLTNFTIPNNVTNIGVEAFGNCQRLTSITIPASVTSLEEDAFEGCTSLTNVELPNSVTSIADGAFGYCSHLTNITIPNSLTFLGYGAFGYCTSLKGVTIPDGVPSIADLTFFACSALTNVTLPASVTNIGASVFDGDASLNSINVSPLNPAYSSVNGVLFDKSQTTLIQYPMGNPAQSYVIPNGVSSVGNFAFSDENNFPLTSLASLTIPDSVTNIGQNAFLDNVRLEALYFMGNNPAGGWVSDGASYHLPGTTGFVNSAGFWTTPNPVILQTLPNFGVQSNGFGFTISWASNATVTVAASTNLAAANWQPLQTNILTATNGVWLFSDPEWTNYPTRFYRVDPP